MNLFNKRILKQRLEHFTFPSNNKQKSINKIIKGWQVALSEHDLEKTKEKSVQGEFLIKFFESILGYITHSSGKSEWNLIPSPKTEVDSQEADGSLGFYTTENKITKAVIELKDAKTSLEKKQTSREKGYTPIEQGYLYASKFDRCNWIIVSNFMEIRLYHKNRTQDFYEKFDVLKLDREDEFKKFYYILCKNNLISITNESIIDNLSKETNVQEENITKEFYKKYKQTRLKLFNHLAKNNPNIDKNTILEKTQKIIDRVIFISFCEDLGLLPPNIFRRILDSVKSSFDLSENKIWNQVKGLFHSINIGNPPMNINKFDGGLFSKDLLLDSLNINDESLKELIEISSYDFESDLNINILGHIFEQSISDIEEMKSEVSDNIEKIQKGKRKKEGIYYTPEYITRFIAEQSIGSWLEDKKTELKFQELPNLNKEDYSSIKFTKKGKLKTNKKVEEHISFWNKYREELKNIKVLDPACGSGAFLIQAFDYLYKEGQSVNDELAKLKKGHKQIFDLDKYILKNNLYGTDLNEESVEITKLSLWLKTANKEKELTELDGSIKCGNSLIDDTKVVGEKAFKWEDEFTDIINSGGFNVIIGNPPYVSNRHMYKSGLAKIVKFLDKTYKSAKSGNYDLFIPFIEKGIKLLKQGGLLSFIIPNKFLIAKYSKALLNIIKRNGTIDNIFDLSDIPIFEDASVYPIIIVIRKSSDSRKISFVNKKYINDPLLMTSHRIQKWNYLEQKPIFDSTTIEGKIINKIENSVNVNDKLDFQPGINGFQFSNYAKCITEGKLTKESKRLVVTGNIDRYILLNKKTRYKGTDFTNPYIYYDKNIISEGKWKLFSTPKIMIAGMTKKIEAIIDNNGNYAPGVSVYSILSLKIDLIPILAILNSKLINWYFKTRFEDKHLSGGYISINNTLLKQIPFIETDNQILSETVNLIIKNLENFQLLHGNSLSLISSEYGNTIDLNLSLISWNEFIQRLEKQKIKLSLSKKDQLHNWFRDKQNELKELQNKIHSLDRTIDYEVYKVYGITEKEIHLIENS